MFRDWIGNTISLGGNRIEDGTNNVAEAKETIVTLKVERSLGASKLYLEGYSQIIAHTIIKAAFKLGIRKIM